MTISVPSFVVPKFPTPLFFAPKMPGAHSKVLVLQCYPDVGGTDVWVGANFDPFAHWWVGDHSPKDLNSW